MAQIILTKHAKDRMALYNVTREQVERCIKRGGKIVQTNGLLASYTFLKVAYKKIGEDKYLIKTVFVDR